MLNYSKTRTNRPQERNIKYKIKEEKFINKQRRHMENSILKFFFNVKDLYLKSFFKRIFWPIFNEIVENQDLYRNKDDF